MNTKYILHGGYASHPNEQNNLFFQEILKNTPKQVCVLLNYFAIDDGEYDRRIVLDKSLFEKNNQDKIISFEISNEDKFAEQVKQADVIYLRGGNTALLLEKLEQTPNLNELLKGKIIAGESAGAYVLSTCYYSKTQGGIFKGLGSVPVKTICHYIGENSEKLDDCPKDLEKLLLKDYEFKTFEADL